MPDSGSVSTACNLAREVPSAMWSLRSSSGADGSSSRDERSIAVHDPVESRCSPVELERVDPRLLTGARPRSRQHPNLVDDATDPGQAKRVCLDRLLVRQGSRVPGEHRDMSEDGDVDFGGGPERVQGRA